MLISEFLNNGWGQSNKYELSPSIMNVIDNFNKTTRLIQTHILRYEKSRKRANAIEFWLEVSNELITLANFNVMLMVSCALESKAIYRLKKSWSKVNKKVFIYFLKFVYKMFLFSFLLNI